MPRPLLFREESGPAARRRDESPVPMRSDISIAISGWRPGFSKVSATHLLSGICGYRLSDAKRTIDEILEGRKVTISLPLAVRPNIIVHQLRNLGLEARLDAMPVFLEVKPDPGRG